MGWLFSVSLGLQEKSGKAVLDSLLPLGVGHLASVGLVVGLAELASFTLPVRTLRVIAAVVLVSFGTYRLVRRRHFRWVGMRVNSRDLTLWSFLMASAHGAGLMLLPFILSGSPHAMPQGQVHHMMTMASATSTPGNAVVPYWLPVAMHTLGYLLATAILAMIVYYKLGVAILRRAWFNLDYLWVAALIASGILTLLI